MERYCNQVPNDRKIFLSIWDLNSKFQKIPEMFYHFLKDKFVTDLAGNWYYYDFEKSQWFYDSHRFKIRIAIFNLIPKINLFQKDLMKIFKNTKDNEILTFLNQLYSLESDISKFKTIREKYLKQCETIFLNQEKVLNLPFIRNIDYRKLITEEQEMFQNEVMNLKDGEYILTNIDTKKVYVHVQVKEINPIHIIFICPFCYKKYKNSAKYNDDSSYLCRIEPTVRSKKEEHLDDSDGDLSTRSIEVLKPYCWNLFEIKHRFVLWITPNTIGVKIE